MQDIFLVLLLLTRTIGILKLRRLEFGLTGKCIEEGPCNIWPEYFCGFKSFKNVFLRIVNMKIFEKPGSIQE